MEDKSQASQASGAGLQLTLKDFIILHSLISYVTRSLELEVRQLEGLKDQLYVMYSYHI